MAFHTFLGMYTAKEYRSYKNAMLLTLAKKERRKSMLFLNNANLVKDSHDNEQYIHEQDGDLEIDDVLSADEFKYPRARRINWYVNIVFISLFGLFNVIYWSVAAYVYLSNNKS